MLVELVRSDKAWSSGKTEIDKNGNVIEANLLEGKPNSFDVFCYDSQGNTLPCFPTEITIIQGAKVGAAPLPYNIGIAIWDSNKERAVFRMARGLEKNKPVPATGVVNDLKTTNELRPGEDSDVLTIPIYQVDDFNEAENRPVSLYEHVGDVIITGDEVEQLIALDSRVDVTLKVDSSEQMTLEVYFPSTDTTVDKPLDTSKKQSIEDAENVIANGIAEAHRSINRLNASGISTSDIQQELEQVQDEAANSSEKKMVLQHLKEVLRKIETLDENTEWQRVEAELREEFERLEKAQNDLGNDQSAQIVEHLRSQVEQVIRTKNVKVGRDVLGQISTLFVQLTIKYQCIGLIRQYNERFSLHLWKNPSRARQLINRGLEIISNNPSTEALVPIVKSILDQLPDEETVNAGGLLK